MTSLEQTRNLSINRTHERVSWALLAGLLFLRLPFLAGIAYFSKPDWLHPTFEVGTYILTIAMVWQERDRLTDFHIDALVIWIIVLFKPIQTLFLRIAPDNQALAFPGLPSLIIWVCAVGLLIALWPKRSELLRLQTASFRWFGIGAVVGVFAVMLLGYPMALQIGKEQPSAKPEALWALLTALPFFFYQLGYAAVTEEPLFRGFLWGHLRKLCWKEVWIWLFQALLFMLGHIYYLGRLPMSFWIIVPIGSLVMDGWLGAPAPSPAAWQHTV